jgi:hypothetical protein
MYDLHVWKEKEKRKKKWKKQSESRENDLLCILY